MNILFITSNRLGDAVLSTGALKALESRYHNASFTVACGPHAAELFRAVPGLRRVIVLRKRSFNRHWIGLWQDCVGTKWDIVVDLRNSVVSRLLWARQRAVKAKAKGWAKGWDLDWGLGWNRGWGRGWGRDLGQGSRGNGQRNGPHKVWENAQVLSSLGWRDFDAPTAPYLWLDEEAVNEADGLLGGRSAVFALAPSANWPCKQWPVNRFSELARRITAPDGLLPGATALIAAAPNERGQVEPLLRDIPEDRRIDLIGKPLLTVAACLRRARLFVGNDSGLTHVAAAVGAPTLGLFGPGQEEVYGPYGSHCAVVRTPESREALLARLPFPGAHAPNLMETLGVEAVEAAARRLVGA